MLTAAMALSGFALYAVVFGMVPLLLERGVDTATAAWALGLGGLGQTFGWGFYGLLVAKARGDRPDRGAHRRGRRDDRTAGCRARPDPVDLRDRDGGGDGAGEPDPVAGDLDHRPLGHPSLRAAVRNPHAPVTVAGAIASWAGATLAQRSGGYAQLSVVAAGIALFTTTRRPAIPAG
jgi:hypothetical protein